MSTASNREGLTAKGVTLIVNSVTQSIYSTLLTTVGDSASTALQ